MKPRPQLTRLRSYFAGVTEHVFQTKLGLVNPLLIDYVIELLVKFARCDSSFRIRDVQGKQLYQVTDMLGEASHRIGKARLAVHQHIGDFTLYWTGVFPESLNCFQSSDRADHLIDYCSTGKRSYKIASKIAGEDEPAESAVLEQLSHEFDICVYGLREVRRVWEHSNQ